MGGENQHLGYLNMLGSAGGIECHVGNVIASQWLYATVNIVGSGRFGLFDDSCR